MLFILMSILLSSSFSLSMPPETTVSSFTQQIYYRYYIIQRCHNSIHLLTTDSKLWKKINYDLLSTEHIENDLIKKTIEQIKETKERKYFLYLWNSISTHRHIQDQNFEKDFVKFLFMLYKSIAEFSLTHLNDQKNRLSAVNINYSLENMLNTIDEKVDILRSTSHSYKPLLHKNITQENMHVDDIALTYYFIQRLNKSIKILSHIQKKEGKPLAKSPQYSSHTVAFTHERISGCATAMFIQKDLDPLFAVWDEFTHFRYAGDNRFLKEMLMLIFSAYKDLLLKNLQYESEQIVINEIGAILEIYEHLDELPLDKVLEAIDLTTDKLMLLQNAKKKDPTQWSIDNAHPFIYTLIALPIAYFLVKTYAG